MECVTLIWKYFNFISLVGIVKYWDILQFFERVKFVPSTFLWFHQMFLFVYNAHLHFKKMTNIPKLKDSIEMLYSKQTFQ